MFRWYRSKIKEFGLFKATVLSGRVAWSLGKTKLANKFLPAKITCPCCGWKGRRFYDYIEVKYVIRNVACPQCDSHARHRAFFLWLNREYRLETKRGVALIFAPERALTPIWSASPGLRVYQADIDPARRPNLLSDLTHLPIASDAIDLLWCHHVLEHIEDDQAAIRELHRILRPVTGELIISVPMYTGSKTIEYGYADPEESGHWRVYGDDFAEMLTMTGFDIRPMFYNLPPQERTRFGINEERFYICTKMGAAS